MTAARLLAAGALVALTAACADAVAAAPPKSAASAEIALDKLAQCKTALAGNRDHAFRLARRHLFGMGVRRNPRTGVAWLRVAAALGHQ